MKTINKAPMIIILLLIGCTSLGTYANGPLFKDIPVSPSGNSILCIYRVDSIHMNTPMIYIDNTPFVKLDKKGYSWVYLKNGLYKIKIDFDKFGYTPFYTEILIKGGEEIYLRLYDIGGSIRLNNYTKEKAKEEIKDFRFIEPITVKY